MAEEAGAWPRAAEGMDGMDFGKAGLRFVRWCREDMLPLWMARGIDRRHGGFYEQLHFDGTPDTRAVRRVRVTARQIYALSHASLMGWSDARERVAWAVEYLMHVAWAKDGEPGFAHLLDADGAVLDKRRDLYDHAFHIMALSWASRACDDGQMLHLAQQTLAFVDEAMGAPAGGWFEGMPASLPRRQNPHMHMLEALLALHEASEDGHYLDRADALITLMGERFMEAQSGLLLEDYDAALNPLCPGRAEPGHMAEWCWLLHTRARLGKASAPALAAALGGRADQFAGDHGGFLPDQVNITGKATVKTRRLWGQTEWLKSLLVRERKTGAAALLARLEQSYFETAVPGLWVDQFDLDGQPLSTHVPASIVYHLVSAAAQVQRALPKPEKKPDV